MKSNVVADGYCPLEDLQLGDSRARRAEYVFGFGLGQYRPRRAENDGLHGLALRKSVVSGPGIAAIAAGSKNAWRNFENTSRSW